MSAACEENRSETAAILSKNQHFPLQRFCNGNSSNKVAIVNYHSLSQTHNFTNLCTCKWMKFGIYAVVQCHISGNECPLLTNFLQSKIELQAFFSIGEQFNYLKNFNPMTKRLQMTSALDKCMQ